MTITTFDLETTGLSPFKDKIFSYCIGYDDGRVDVFDYNKDKIQKYFNDTSIEKIAHNYKFEYSMLRMHDIYIPDETVWHDTMLMSQLLNNMAYSHGLKEIYWTYDTEADRTIDTEVMRQVKERGMRFDRVDKELFRKYQILDGQRPMLLFKLFYPKLKSNDALYAEYRNEIEFVKVCFEMEKEGLQVNVKETESLLEYLDVEINKLIKTADYTNLKSDAKVRNLLFNQLKLPSVKYTEGGSLSVDKEVILELRGRFPAHESVFNLILKTRAYTYSRSIIRSYLKFKGDDNIIHPSIQSNEAATGRPSCRNPNLLNVAKEDVLNNPYPIPARKCFQCKNEEILYFVDYAGLQMRLIADDCNEQEMIETINKGGDVHQVPTELFYGKSKDKFTDKEWKKYRGAGKNTNFAMPFGCSPVKAAAVLGLPLNVARARIDAYKRRFPRVANYAKSKQYQVKTHGYIVTPHGRILYVPKNKAYMGANYYIQGAEAGLMKRAMNKIFLYFKNEWNDNLRLVLDIYDEIIFSCPVILEKYESIFVKDVTELMTHIDGIKIRLDAEWKKSYTTWYDAKGFKV